MFQRSLLEEMSKLVFRITKFLYKKILRKRILPKKQMQLCLFLQSSLAIDIKVFLFFFFFWGPYGKIINTFCLWVLCQNTITHKPSTLNMKGKVLFWSNKEIIFTSIRLMLKLLKSCQIH